LGKAVETFPFFVIIETYGGNMEQFELTDDDFANILDSFDELYKSAVNRKDYITSSMIREEVRKLLSGNGPLIKIEDSIGICNPFEKAS
jgi:hypothetical protein